MIKKTRYFTYISLMAISLLAIGLLAITACGEKNQIDQRLVGSWSNRQAGSEAKTFKIEKDGSFTATLIAPGSPDSGTVTGKLVKEGDDYVMGGMKETTGKDWGKSVGIFNGTLVQIIFSDDKTFSLECKDDKTVEDFFGGTYYKE